MRPLADALCTIGLAANSIGDEGTKALAAALPQLAGLTLVNLFGTVRRHSYPLSSKRAVLRLRDDPFLRLLVGPLGRRLRVPCY